MTTRTFELQDAGTNWRFEIRTMPATQGEAFIIRLLLLAGKNMEMSPTLSGMDLFKALLSGSFDDTMYLLDELLGCCYRILGPSSMEQVRRETADGWATSPLTLLRLRWEAAAVNFSFFMTEKDLFSRVLANISPTVPKSVG